MNLPTGILYGPHRAFTVQATGQLNNAEAYRPLIVAYRNGSPVRLGDIATVVDSVENNKVAAWYVNPTASQTVHHSGRSSGSPAPTPWRWRMPLSDCCPPSADQLPASVSMNILYRPLDVHPRVGHAMSNIRCC